MVLTFLRLGCTSFGGPIAHLGYFQNELIQQRKWVSDATYADVVALCQFLPGPASSQVAFVLGYIRSGFLGGFLGWMAFTAPSALLMIGFAYGIELSGIGAPGWLLGLKVAAVAVVAQALWTMIPRLCPDPVRIALMICCTLILIFYRTAWLQPAMIALGALMGLALLKIPSTELKGKEALSSERFLRPVSAGIVLALFAVLLVLSLGWRGGNILPDTFARFYRTGALVFGGGHVVLPLLQAETVNSGLVSHDIFLAGYGAAQAVPGPLFTFAAFLGASIHSTYPPWLLGAWCLAAILLPSLLLIVGVLPFWTRLAGNARARAALGGANTAVVGLLAAAFYDPVLKTGVTSLAAAIMAMITFALLQFWKVPNWVTVLGCAVLGELLL